jgi:hypothetical protein
VPSKEAKWNYALIVNEDDPSKSFEIKKVHVPANVYPWEVAPIQLEVKAQEVPQWKTTEVKMKIEDNRVYEMIFEKIVKRKHWMDIKWGKRLNGEIISCDIPESPVKPTGNVVTLTLVPYGFTQLRITSFPYVKQ